MESEARCMRACARGAVLVRARMNELARKRWRARARRALGCAPTFAPSSAFACSCACAPPPSSSLVLLLWLNLFFHFPSPLLRLAHVHNSVWTRHR
eukprot:3355544-Pleurochrysis_carterae.AAC.1